MPSSSPSRKNNMPVPKGYSLHEPGPGGASKEVLQQRFERLEKLMAKAKKLYAGTK
jgi:hypothetical protein